MRGIVLCEMVGFGILGIFLWLDELMDLPHHLLKAPATPVNWRESLIESLFLVALALFVIISTVRLIRRIRYLEGTIPICASCHKVRINEKWTPVEVYVTRHSEARFSHGICPECSIKLYGEDFTNDQED
jgi:hypothetical protein